MKENRADGERRVVFIKKRRRRVRRSGAARGDAVLGLKEGAFKAAFNPVDRNQCDNACGFNHFQVNAVNRNPQLAADSGKQLRGWDAAVSSTFGRFESLVVKYWQWYHEQPGWEAVHVQTRESVRRAGLPQTATIPKQNRPRKRIECTHVQHGRGRSQRKQFFR